MTQDEAGRNAAKWMLSYAIERFPRGQSKATESARDRAIVLFNSYGYGYAIGSSFVGENGNHGMLFPADLDEIAEMGVTRDGGRLR